MQVSKSIIAASTKFIIAASTDDEVALGLLKPHQLQNYAALPDECAAMLFIPLLEHIHIQASCAFAFS